jgi:ribonuclease Z
MTKRRGKMLSQLDADGFTLLGYSVAGEESVIIAPELDCAFDIGKCPREALTVNHVLLSHGHTDHFAGLPYYFAQRDFQGIEGGKVLLPASLADPVAQLMKVWGRIDGQQPPYEIIPMEPGQDYAIRRDLVARAFATRHRNDSLGYTLLDVRYKLKSEYTDLAGPELVKLKGEGVEITRRVEVPLVTYLGDTGPANYHEIDHVANAKVLLLECTFFDDDHQHRARAGKHLHVQDLPSVLEGMNNERIVLIHVTRRTHMGHARKMLKNTLDADTFKRVTFLMDKENIPQD